jgi:hypothetical protein
VIKLSANLSKKVPMPGVEFSSQQYGAAMEVEVSDGANAQEVAQRLQTIYGLLEKSIDQQTAQPGAGKSSPAQTPERPFLGEADGKPQPATVCRNASPRRRNGHASPAQIRMVFGLCKERNISREDLTKLIQAEFTVDKADDLSIKQASDLIGRLQKEVTRR